MIKNWNNYINESKTEFKWVTNQDDIMSYFYNLHDMDGVSVTISKVSSDLGMKSIEQYNPNNIRTGSYPAHMVIVAYKSDRMLSDEVTIDDLDMMSDFFKELAAANDRLKDVFKCRLSKPLRDIQYRFVILDKSWKTIEYLPIDIALQHLIDNASKIRLQYMASSSPSVNRGNRTVTFDYMKQGVSLIKSRRNEQVISDYLNKVFHQPSFKITHDTGGDRLVHSITIHLC